MVGLICSDRVLGDGAAVQIQCAFCAHIDTAAVTGSCVFRDRAAVHVHRAVYYLNAAAEACSIAASQRAAVHVKSGIIIASIVNTDAAF